MARILFALDLGAGYGHLTRVLPVADWLAARGHEAVLALRPGGAGAPLLAGRPHRVVPAPTRIQPIDGMPVADSYADILLRTGHAEPAVLDGLLRGWLALYERERPALVVGEFAPSALLAARIAGRRLAMIGCGFTLPPRTRPMPRLRPWARIAPGRIALSEARALGAINAALSRFGAPGLAALEESLAVDRSFLCSFPEFDHYGDRPDADYYGNMYMAGDGASPLWPGPAGAPGAFAYLAADTPNLLPLLGGLAANGMQTILHARGLTPHRRAQLPGEGLVVSDTPVRVVDVLAGCAMVVCHSPNTAAAALLAGRPVLLLPSQVEQQMIARRLAAQGLALVLPTTAGEAECTEAVRALYRDPRYLVAARRFAARYHGYDPAEAAAAIGEGCEALLSDTI